MKVFSIIEQPSEQAIKVFAEKRGLTEYIGKKYMHPQEDYLLTSANRPIFVVADGVTLNVKRLVEKDMKYPNPSPAGEVAKIFCKAIQEQAQKKYEDLNEYDIKDIFKEGNKAVALYNKKIGQSEFSGNQTGYYSATGSFVIIKDDKAYWASICDAFFAHFDKHMNQKFISSGLCVPYAVINGEERMADHIEHGVVTLESGDRVFVFTDGFEHYIKNPDFIELFRGWTDKLDGKVKDFSMKMNMEDPEKYGHERSLIAVLV